MPRNKLIKTTKARQQITRPSSGTELEPIKTEKQVQSTKQSTQQVLTESYKGLPGSSKDSQLQHKKQKEFTPYLQPQPNLNHQQNALRGRLMK
jgi:hypothetical protein